jgi:Pyruvate/2-oxoacid:ferredoxin oxidoreductase delta subunit
VASGEPFEAVPDLCELAARHDPALARLAEAGAVHIAACHPRAVRWLFAYAGAPLGPRAVLHDMRAEAPDAILRDVLPEGKVPHPDACATAALLEFPEKGPGDWIPWFPVVDYDRCVACRQCLEFCLFGVYADAPDGSVRVVQPAKCKTNCPACARVCPESAIIFPKFADGPISGEDGRLAAPAADTVRGDFEKLSSGDAMDVLRRRAAKAREAARRNDPRRPPRE